MNVPFCIHHKKCLPHIPALTQTCNIRPHGSHVLQKFGYVHLSAGDLLREERAKPGSEYGELIEGHIKNGTIVPVEITCSLLERAMKVGVGWGPVGYIVCATSIAITSHVSSMFCWMTDMSTHFIYGYAKFLI